eukprot:COSAG02_NODE_5780_length_4039_cov_9.386041_1_plen_544_part_00
MTFEVGAHKRLVVAAVESDGNAARAGLRQGLVLASVNGKAADNSRTGLKLLKRKPPLELALCEPPVSSAGAIAARPNAGLAKFKAAGGDVIAKLREEEAQIVAELAAIDSKKAAACAAGGTTAGLAKFKAAGGDVIAKLREEEAQIVAELAAMDAKKAAANMTTKAPIRVDRNVGKFAFADAGQAVIASLRAEEAAIVAELKVLGASEEEIDRIGRSRLSTIATAQTQDVQANAEGQKASPAIQGSADAQKAAARREARQRKVEAENWAVGPRPDHPTWTSRRWCIVRNSYAASKARDLTITKGDMVRLTWGEPKKWWCGENISAGPAGKVGEFPNNYVQVLRKAISRRDYPVTATRGSAEGVAATLFDPEKDLRFRKGDIIVLTDSRPTKRWWTGFVLDPRWESDYGISSREGLQPPDPRTFPADFVTMEPVDGPIEITATFVPLQGHSTDAGGSATLTVKSRDTVEELIEQLVASRSDVVGSVASKWPEGWKSKFQVVVGNRQLKKGRQLSSYNFQPGVRPVPADHMCSVVVVQTLTRLRR